MTATGLPRWSRHFVASLDPTAVDLPAITRALGTTAWSHLHHDRVRLTALNVLVSWPDQSGFRARGGRRAEERQHLRKAANALRRAAQHLCLLTHQMQALVQQVCSVAPDELSGAAERLESFKYFPEAPREHQSSLLLLLSVNIFRATEDLAGRGRFHDKQVADIVTHYLAKDESITPAAVAMTRRKAGISKIMKTRDNSLMR